MTSRNRRRHFLIDKPLQFHYVFYIVFTLAVVSAVGIAGTYYGIWASAITAFSEDSLYNSLVTASQINEYELSRKPSDAREPLTHSSLRFFNETALLSAHQQDTLRNILDETQKRTVWLGCFLLFFIGWGSIFLTHKIAGPLYKLRTYLAQIEQGNLAARVGFRKHDEVRYLAASFNNMAQQLDGSVTKLKEIAKKLPPSSVAEELKKELGKLKTTAE